MEFNLNTCISILERTPAILESILHDIPDEWAFSNEGENTFSPYDVAGHLVHGEKTDWMVRLEIILSESGDKDFTPYDRFAQFTESKGKSMNELLQEFRKLRNENVAILLSKDIKEADLIKTGNHPAFGRVTLQELLAAWTVHDLSHIAQITRVMSKQLKKAVGPWVNFLPILTRR